VVFVEIGSRARGFESERWLMHPWLEYSTRMRLGHCIAVIGCWVSLAAPAFASKRLALAEAIALARANPLARAAIEQRRVAEARAAEVDGARFPHVEITGFVAPSPEVRCENADCTRTRPNDVRPTVKGVFGGARFELVQPLYTFGKLDAASDGAASLVKMNAAAADATLGDLALETTRAYFGVEVARELAAMLDDGAKQLAARKQTLSDQLAKGDPEVTLQDRMRLESFQAEVLIRLAQAHQDEAVALAGLRGLVGDPTADSEEGSILPVEFPLAGVEAYLSEALSARPELRQARHGVAALGAQVSLERARWLPDVAFLAGANIARAQGADDPPSAFAYDPFNTTRAELALVMRWSVDPATQLARVARARAEQTRGRALLEAAGLAGQFAVRQAYDQAAGAKARLDAAQSGEKTARGWVASVVQADAVGTVSAREIADAYLAFFTLRSHVLESTFEWNLAVAALKRATGLLVQPTTVP
jgi:outer membrane protein TolC